MLAACLTERGWDVSVSGDALMSGDIPNEQIAAYGKDSDECGENLTPDLRRESLSSDRPPAGQKTPVRAGLPSRRPLRSLLRERTARRTCSHGSTLRRLVAGWCRQALVSSLKALVPVIGATVLLLTGCTVVSPGGDAAPSASPSATAGSSTNKLFKGTVNEYAVALAACMTEKGWPATAGSPDDAEGGSSITYEYIPDDQQSAFEADQTECTDQLGMFDDGLSTEAGLRSGYDWYIGQGRCLGAVSRWPRSCRT